MVFYCKNSFKRTCKYKKKINRWLEKKKKKTLKNLKDENLKSFNIYFKNKQEYKLLGSSSKILETKMNLRIKIKLNQVLTTKIYWSTWKKGEKKSLTSPYKVEVYSPSLICIKAIFQFQRIVKNCQSKKGIFMCKFQTLKKIGRVNISDNYFNDYSTCLFRSDKKSYKNYCYYWASSWQHRNDKRRVIENKGSNRYIFIFVSFVLMIIHFYLSGQTNAI